MSHPPDLLILRRSNDRSLSMSLGGLVVLRGADLIAWEGKREGRMRDLVASVPALALERGVSLCGRSWRLSEAV